MSHTMSNYTNFGRYEGLLRDTSTDAEFQLVIDQDNFKPYKPEKHPFAIDGYFEWTVIAGSKYHDCIGQQAMSKVRGLYFNCDGSNTKDRYHFICMTS